MPLPLLELLLLQQLLLLLLQLLLLLLQLLLLKLLLLLLLLLEQLLLLQTAYAQRRPRAAAAPAWPGLRLLAWRIAGPQRYHRPFLDVDSAVSVLPPCGLDACAGWA